jgi:hypothetical protein
MAQLLPLLLVAILGACHAAPEQAAWKGEAIDGVWLAETIDGRSVGRSRYTINVAEGRVTGGRDGCNDWGFDYGERERTIVSTLIGCPADPLFEGYWAVVNPQPWHPQLRADGRLEATAGRHVVVLRRDR